MFDIKPLEELSDSEILRRINLIKEFKETDGWKLMQKQMEAESDVINRRFMGLGIDKEVLDYYRGALFTVDKLLNMPESMLKMLEDTLKLRKQPPSDDKESS